MFLPAVSHKSYEWRCNFGTVTFADGGSIPHPVILREFPAYNVTHSGFAATSHRGPSAGTTRGWRREAVDSGDGGDRGPDGVVPLNMCLLLLGHVRATESETAPAPAHVRACERARGCHCSLM